MWSLDHDFNILDKLVIDMSSISVRFQCTISDGDHIRLLLTSSQLYLIRGILNFLTVCSGDK